MKHYTVEQGSQEWHALRSVIPTASAFDRLITPAKWEPTKGDTRKGFMLELLANRICGISVDDLFSSAAMDHGREWEPIARAAYEFEQGVEIQDGGFFTDDEGRYGASPDGLIGDDGLIELKNPAVPKVHLSALVDCIAYSKRGFDWTEVATDGSDVTGFVRDHWTQVQGQLLVTGRKWCDLVSNFRGFPLVVVRVYPNPAFLDLLQRSLNDFCYALQCLTETARERGWYKPTQPQVVEDGLGITDADVDALIARQRELAGAAR